jgi:hypothetical protein
MIEITAGDNRDLVYTIVDENDNVINLTGGSITWTAYVSGTSTAVITKSTSSGIALTDPTNGVATVSLEPADTTSLKGTYILDGQFTDSGSDVYTFEKGGLEIQ